MWGNILKVGQPPKKLNFTFLKQISLNKAKDFKGKTLIKDEFLDFLESIRLVYSTKHTGIPLDRIRTTIVRVLKQNDLLEVKMKRLGPKEYGRIERIYIFKE